MDTLLSWLLSVADYVYYLFGRGWKILWNVVNNIVDWLYSGLNNLQFWVFTFVGTLIADVRAEIQSVASSISSLFSEAIDYAIQLFDNLRNYVINQIHNTINLLETDLSNVYNAISASLTGIKDWAVALITQAIVGLRSDILALVNPVIAYFPFLRDLNTALANGGLAKLVDLLQNVYDQIVLFARDPVGYILGLIWSDILSFLSYAIAYALGTVNSDLPPLPVWGQGGKGKG